MACSQGHRRIPGSPNVRMISAADINCGFYGVDSFICQYAQATAAGLIPASIIPDVDAFCAAGPPPPPTTIDATDFLTPTAIGPKIIANARSQVFNELCECIPIPPDVPGGQCPTNYVVAWSGEYFSSFFNANQPRNGTDVLMGPITGSETRFVSTNIVGFYIQHNGTETLVDQVTASLGTVEPRTMQIDSVATQDGSPDDCGDGPGTPEDPDPPAPSPPVSGQTPPADDVPQPPAGPAGPPGADGPAGPAGPCPTLNGGTVTVEPLAPEEDPVIEFVLVGDCEYDVNLMLPGIETEERDLLIGITYTVTAFPVGASFTLTQQGKYFNPRCASIVFVETATNERSEAMELHGENGYVRNPDRLKYDSFVSTPYTPGYTFNFVNDLKTVQVAEDIVLRGD